MNVRTIVAVLALLSLLSIATGGYLYFHSLRESAANEAEREFAVRSEGFRKQIQRLLSTYQRETSALASFEELQSALLDRTDENVAKANRILDHFADGLAYDVCYLMDVTGNTIASSNRDRGDGFVGHNYSNRAYFLEAIQGKPSIFLAVGVTSGIRGIYFGYPVRGKNDKVPLGVAVVKASVEDLEQQIATTNDETVMLVHSSGIIFVSSRSDWLLNLLWKSSEEQQSRIADSNQFGKGPWKWTGLEKKNHEHAFDSSGEIFLTRELPLKDSSGWKLVSLYSVKDMQSKFADPLRDTTGSVALILCLFLAAAVVALYKMAWKDISSRQQAEETLKLSEASYRSIFDSMNDAIFVHDARTGQIVDVNRQMLEMYGYSYGEARNLSLEQISLNKPPYSGEEARHWARKALHEGPQLFEWMAKNKAGKSFWVEVSLRQGVVEGKQRTLAVVRDIAARKQGEKALHQSEERFRALYEDNPSMYFTLDADTRVMSVNRFGAEQLGYSVEELVGQPVEFLIYPDDRDTAREQLSKCLNNPMQLGEMQFRKVRKDGSTLWVKEVARAVQDPEGVMVVLVVCEDITERKRAEEALRDSEEKLKAVVEGCPIPQFVIDRDHKVIYWNKALAAISGIKAEEVIGTKNHFSAFYSDRRPCLADLIVDGEQEGISQWYGGKHGRSRLLPDTHVFTDFIPILGDKGKWLQFSVAEIRDSRGGLIGAVETLQDITELKVAEEALKIQTERFQMLADHASFGMVMIGRDGSFQYVNPKFTEIVGYGLNDVPNGREWFRNAFPDRTYRHLVISSWIEDSKRHVAGKIQDRVFTVTCGDGAMKLVHFAPVRLRSGEDMMTIEDVTDRMNSETALRESEAKYRTIFENSGTALMFVEDDSTISMNNRMFEELSGYSKAEVEGRMKWTDFVAKPEDLERMEEFHRARRTLPEMVPRTYEFQFIDRDRNLKDVVISTVLLPGTDQSLMALLDITERKRAEEELVRLVTAVGQAAEGFVVTDNDWLIQYVNPAVESITGFDANEILGCHVGILVSDGHYTGVFGKNRDPLPSVEVWSGRLINKKKNGEIYEAEVTASPVRDKTGTIINYVSIVRDITHEVKLERELRQAQKMEAIGTLAGGIAHDFNNILMAISGYTQLASAGVEDGTAVKRHLDQVLLASSRAKDLVKQILTFSRLTEQERRPLSVGSILKEALKLLRSSLPSTIEIRQEILATTEQDTVLADPTQIHQVVMNLCTNAAHAMRVHGGRLTVGLSHFAAGDTRRSRFPGLAAGPHLCLTVTDTGHGMDAAVKERIFDPYFTTKGSGEGTGLGLAVVQGIVRGHGGMISVDSEPGQGTTFNVFLPQIAHEIVHEHETSWVLPTGSERVLFVDDEHVLAELGKEMLEALGYAVTTMTNAHDALNAFRNRPEAFDLVITDMTMPGLTGRELAKELMALKPDLPVILCTGFSELVNANEVKESGIRELVMKPYAINNLAVTIRQVLHDS